LASEDHNIEEQAGEPQAPLPAGNSGDSGERVDADLDLFDFPVLEDPFAEAAHDPLAEQTPVTTITQPVAPVDEPGLSEIMSVDKPDFDLDEDILNFGELFTAAEGQAGDDAIRTFSEQAPEATDAYESEPEIRVASRLEPEPVAAASSPTSAPAPIPRHAVDTLAGRDFDLTPLLVGAVQRTDLDLAPERSSIIRDNMIEVLVILFLSVNAALIVFAWQANTSFHSTLDGVRTDIADSLRDVGTSQLLAAAPAHTDAEPELVVVDEAPTPFASYAELELGLAREAMANGAYAVARRRLYRLLANQDRFPISAGRLATSEYLIADSYFEEGRALEGSRR
jgi:hypothetical protein